MNTYGILIMGVLSLSLLTVLAYAQGDNGVVGGLPVPLDETSLFMSVLGTNLLWIIPAATAGVVIYKFKFNTK